jgi:radical SAM protein with 4Fe4S-binding SPASM domain
MKFAMLSWWPMPSDSQFERIDYLVVEANSSCNLACTTCNRVQLEEQGLRAKKNLSEGELRRILEPFRATKVDTIKFEWLSEPMLHPEFDRLCAVLRAYFPAAQVIIATNLQYEPGKTRLFRTLPMIDIVYLSIDGVGEVYERQRVGSRFSRLLKSLEAIQENVPAEVRKQKLHIQFTATESNYLSLPAVYQLKERYGLASVRINLAQQWSVHSANPHHFNDEMVSFLRRYREDIKGVPGWDYKNCFWPFNGITVDVFGDVRACIIKTDAEPIGNVFRQSVREIYNHSPRYQNMRETLNKNCAPDDCRHCDYKHLSPLLAEIFDGSSPATPRAKADYAAGS